MSAQPNVPPKAFEYIVNEIVRRYGTMPPRFVPNLRRSVRRNFGVSISAEEIERLVPVYQTMYSDVAAEIHRVSGAALTPPLSEGERLQTQFAEYLKSLYPEEPSSIRELVAGWAVYYEVYR